MKFLNKSYSAFFVLFLAFVLTSCSDSSSSMMSGNGGEGGGSNPPGESFSYTQGPGASAEALLRDGDFTNLRLEVDYMPGYEPTEESLNSLQNFLQQRLNKSSITIVSPTQIPAGGQSSYSADDIRALEQQYRDSDSQTDSNTLYAYLVVVDGRNSDQNSVVGFAYYNASIALFGRTVEEATGGIGAPPRSTVEATVLRHEFGHLMGLVGNGTETTSNHKTDGSAHCTTDGCLMEPEIETANFFANIFGGTIPSLDDACLNDLQANGGK